MGKFIEKVRLGAIGKNMHEHKYEIIWMNPEDRRQVKIKFLETGYETISYNGNLHKGHVTDRFVPTVYGVGILGYKRDYGDPDYKKIFTHWMQMMRRCYDTNYKQYCNYGGEGVRVCERWHYFHNFYDDFSKIDGYSEEIMKIKTFRHLDKDIKQQFNDNKDKIYSLKTCKLVLKEENEKFKRQKARPYVKVINPAGTEFYINNTSEFSRVLNQRIRNKYITYCLNGTKEHHLGWKFEKTTKEEYDSFHSKFPLAPEYPEECDLFYIINSNYVHRKKTNDVIYNPKVHFKRDFSKAL